MSQDTPVQNIADSQPTSAKAMINLDIFDDSHPDNSLVGNVEAPTHPMVTWARTGNSKPNLKYLMQIFMPPPIPTSIASALSNPLWHKAMTDEMEAFIRTLPRLWFHVKHQ